MTTGTITKVVSDRGFGFIKPDNDAPDFFFHHSGLDRSLRFEELTGGERVSFEVESSLRGPRANHIRPA